MTTATTTKPAKKAAPKAAAAPAPIVFTIATRTLLRDLTEVRTFGCTETTLPPINCVNLVMRDGALTFTATDRYVMGVVVEKEVTGADFEVNLSLLTVARILRVLKPESRRDNPPLRVTVTAKEVSIEQASTLTDLSPTVVVVPVSDTQFPDYRKIVSSFKPATEGAPVGLNPSLLAKFARVVRVDHSGITVYPGQPNKPILVVTGDHFTGIVMPIRLPEPTPFTDIVGRFA